MAVPDFDPERELGLFGVFDGHGGPAVPCAVSGFRTLAGWGGHGLSLLISPIRTLPNPLLRSHENAARSTGRRCPAASFALP